MKFIMLLDGMTGAGKTTASEVLRESLPRTAIFGMDQLRGNVSDAERGVRDNGIAREIAMVMAKRYLELDLSVIVDQPHREEDIPLYEKMAKDFDVPIYKFQLFTTPEIAFERIMERQQKRKSRNSNPEERVRRNIGLYKDKSSLGFETIDTSKLEPEEAGKMILNKVTSQ